MLLCLPCVRGAIWFFKWLSNPCNIIWSMIIFIFQYHPIKMIISSDQYDPPCYNIWSHVKWSSLFCNLINNHLCSMINYTLSYDDHRPFLLYHLNNDHPCFVIWPFYTFILLYKKNYLSSLLRQITWIYYRNTLSSILFI